jgi:hypothetical protein
MGTKKKNMEMTRTSPFSNAKSCPNFERKHVSTEEEDFFHFERS